MSCWGYVWLKQKMNLLKYQMADASDNISNLGIHGDKCSDFHLYFLVYIKILGEKNPNIFFT